MPSVLGVAVNEYGRLAARAWEEWPELFWINILVALVNTATAVIIWINSPESRLVTVPTLSMSTVIVVTGFIAGIVQRRRIREERRMDDSVNS